jgi:hypothetical protein
LELYPRPYQRLVLAALPLPRRILNRLYLAVIVPTRPITKALWDLMGIPHSGHVLMTATGEALDMLVSNYFHRKRNPGETDADFRARLVEYISAYSARKS